MIVLFDTSTLIYLLKPDAPAPKIPGTEERVSDCHQRISYLLSELQKARATIIVPTPVIAEILTQAGAAGPEWLRILTGSRYFKPSPFDALAAVECAAMARTRLGAGKLSGKERVKAKFDEQIVAIGRIERASVIYSDDGDIERLVDLNTKVIGIGAMELPPSEAQGSLDLEPIGDDEQPPPADEVE
jgi:predicted nucleic acid-binding protein